MRNFSRGVSSSSGHRIISDPPLPLRTCALCVDPIELLHYLREQSLSIDYHCYGNLGARSRESRARRCCRGAATRHCRAETGEPVGQDRRDRRAFSDTALHLNPSVVDCVLYALVDADVLQLRLIQTPETPQAPHDRHHSLRSGADDVTGVRDDLQDRLHLAAGTCPFPIPPQAPPSACRRHVP